MLRLARTSDSKRMRLAPAPGETTAAFFTAPLSAQSGPPFALYRLPTTTGKS
jgi:hypothetical protein